MGQCSSLQLNMCWMKRHTGVWGNETADNLTNSAARNPNLLPPINIQLSPSYYKEAFKNHLHDKWIHRWFETPILFSRQDKIWFPGLLYLPNSVLLWIGQENGTVVSLINTGASRSLAIRHAFIINAHVRNSGLAKWCKELWFRSAVNACWPTPRPVS